MLNASGRGRRRGPEQKPGVAGSALDKSLRGKLLRRVFPPIRLLQLLLASVVVACGHEDDTPTATKLVITPDTSVVDASGSFQVSAMVDWTDHRQHPAAIRYSATGGSITATGLYQAGAVPGDYVIVAQCTCGVSDSARVRITQPSPPAPPARASLDVILSGLPADVPATVSIAGRKGFARIIDSTVALDSLDPDEYVVLAHQVENIAGSYVPTPDSQLAVLDAGDHKAVQVTYALTPPSGLPPHPRIWMTPARLAFVQSQAAANSVRWQRVKASADAQLKAGAVTKIGYLPSLCMAYLVTGDAAYAARADAILVANTDSVAQTNLRRDSGYSYRSTLPVVVKGLDWCYSGLSAATRVRTAKWLMDAADWVWPQTNPARQTALAVNSPGSNYFWGFMQTGPAALAADGLDPRSTNHIALALTKWSSTVLPFFTGRNVGGVWEEGTGYETSGNVAAFVDAFATSGTSLDRTWLQDALRWHFHYTMPGGKYMAPIGDQARVSSAPIYIYNRTSMELVRAAAGADAATNALVQRWLDWIGETPVSLDDAGLATELMNYDPAAPEAPTLAALPLTFTGMGAGVMVGRQSWTDPNATAWVFQAGPYTAHNVGAANSLRIWKGSYWVSGDGNIYSSSGIRQNSADFNTATFGTNSQIGYGVAGGNNANLLSSSTSDTLQSVSGQAANTYGYPDRAPHRYVTNFTRSVRYSPQRDEFVVTDTITADPAQPRTIRWQSKLAPTVVGTTFHLTNEKGDGACDGSVTASRTPTLDIQNLQLATNPLQTTSSAVTITLPAGQATDVVVTTLRCSSH